MTPAKQSIGKLRAKGHSWQQIADILGLRSRQHAQQLGRAGPKLPPRRTDPERLAEALELLEAGWTYRAIAKHLKLGMQTIVEASRVTGIKNSRTRSK